ncbi:hypothetical protein [Gordonia terrae]|uniref:Uncharacterized protein n=2 Tax=Gordonia terrae TaxID=2055 RepID=A0A2I1RBF9_9ACTN|nr:MULTISPECIES: hypothetical protein [Gordonia]ANY24080.1 hypothetical protein BCM27_15915 [Gordonia terrae]AWO84823.1 hypothetical protein DLJ61_16080 [Gordonia terrae]PKZ66448.1 hypothetical protein CYJ73_05975 [Gordonia terrae]VTS56910.1 Uncharacterised protein [Gordonia terrae]GAB46083.1 hypothetical protein GOTRE_145_00930 [Gordonia terrae NBRC 100016]
MPDNHARDSDATDVADAWLVEATRQIADEPASDVDRLISSISGSLQRIRRPARTLATDGLRINTSDRVVKQLIAIRTRRELGRLTVFVSVDGDGETVDGVRVGLIARYADDLPALSDDVRDIVDEVLVETLGGDSSAVARRNISVRWQDVYTREWLTR